MSEICSSALKMVDFSAIVMADYLKSR